MRYEHEFWMRGFGAERQIEGPLEVYQRDRLIGTVPGYPVRSRSGIFDVRPHDFTPKEKDGKTILDAHGSICPGDFACIEGFRAGANVPGCYSQPSEAAEMFDAFSKVMGRAEAVGATVEEMLATPRDSGRLPKGEDAEGG